MNVKWYAKREGILDVNPEAIPDFYLVLTGPQYLHVHRVVEKDLGS